jgi:ankyrin repeat protein
MISEVKKIIEQAQKDSLLSFNLFRLCTSYLFIAQFMLDHVGFNINAQDALSNVLLSYPMHRHEVQSFLLSKNPDLNIRNNDGDTPLMLALQRNEPHWYCKNLLDQGADISVKNNNGVSVSSIMPDVLSLVQKMK